MEIFLIKFGYHNEYNVENQASIFLFSLLLVAKSKFWLPYGYMMLVNKLIV